MRIPFFRRDVSPCCLVLGVMLATLLWTLMAGAGLYLARAPVLRALGVWWVVDQPPMKGDAVVVLGGDSPESTRMRRAVDLYQQGWAPRIIISGPLVRTYFSEGFLMATDARRFGAPFNALSIVTSDADSTSQEMQAILDYATAQHFHRLLVVTSDYHTRRTSAIYSAGAKKHKVEVRIIAAPQFLMGGKRWWENHSALKNMFYEVIKYPFSLWEIRHPTPIGQGPKDS